MTANNNINYKLMLFIISLVVLSSCQNEELLSDQEKSFDETGYNTIFKKGKLSDFKNLNQFISSDIVDYNNLNLQFRSSTEDVNGFTIITSDIIQAESNNSTTFTLKIVKDNQEANSFSNLIISFDTQGATKAYIINYYPTENYLANVEIDPKASFQGQYSIESINYNGDLDYLYEESRYNCEYITIQYCNWSEGNEEGEEHLAGENCTASFMYSKTYMVCRYVADYEPHTDNSLGSPNHSSSGGGGGNSSNTTTKPEYVKPCEIANTDINMGDGSVSLTENTCNESNTESNETVDDCMSVIDETLIEQLNTSLGTANYAIDCLLSEENTIGFDSIEALESLFDEINNSTEGNSSVSVDTQNQTIKTETIKINSNPDVFFEVQFVLNSSEIDDGLEYSITDVNTNLIGSTFFMEWEESTPTLIQNIENEIVIQINGHITFGVEVFGVPLNVIKPYVCILKINKQTGNTIFKWFYENV
ncbi:hypothetical protein [uncultured Psychroserpens sp.]|uniref:hypothetical protein n=1 Tax=uncultured Psychroserpens sp. TaxID=255436 RepID=UPI00262F77C4|nr:hypothetical protein [uncultured Psychroserpens sp.]